MAKKIFEQIMFKRKIIAIVIVAIVIIALAGVYTFKAKNKVYTKIEVTSKVNLDMTLDREFIDFGKGILAYNKDGISYYNGKKEVFNVAYTMTNPVVATSDSYVVVAEKNASNIVLIKNDGSQTTMTATYAIVDIDVSNQGVVVATLDDGQANYIEFYDKDGTRLVSGRTVLEGDGFPVDISISDDATRLVVSYLSISEGKAQSKVVFYNYTSVGENEVDRIVGGFNQYTDTIVPDVEFINNNTAIAVGDNMFSVYSIDEKPSLVHEEEFNDKINSVFYNGKYIGIIFESSEASYSQVLKVYNTKGKKEYSKSIDFNYDDVKFIDDNVMFYDNSVCRMYSFDNKERFNYTFDDISIKRIVPETVDNIIIVGEGIVEKVKLK